MVADFGTLQRCKNDWWRMVREMAFTTKHSGNRSRKLGLWTARLRIKKPCSTKSWKLPKPSPQNPRFCSGRRLLLHTRDHSVADGLNYIATWMPLLSNDGKKLLPLNGEERRKFEGWEKFSFRSYSTVRQILLPENDIKVASFEAIY
jgi:enoyl-CoA hydratase